MIIDEKQKNHELYAKLYAKYKIEGTQYLPFRDLPFILNTHVKGKKVLDYGSGSGESSLFLKSLGYDVTGVDINDEMISIAKSRDPMGKYLKIDSTLPFDNNTFDFILCSFVLLEIESKDIIFSIVKEINRVLKKGAIFISIAASEHTYKHNWLTLNTDFPENKNIQSGSRVKIEFRNLNLTIYDYYWTEEDYKKIFINAGYDIILVHNPLGTSKDKYQWLDEKKVSPSSIIVCGKT